MGTLPLLPSLLRFTTTHHLQHHFKAPGNNCYCLLQSSFPSILKPTKSRNHLSPHSIHSSTSTSFPFSFYHRKEPEEVEDIDEDHVIGDCVVFEEGAFEGGDPFFPSSDVADAEPPVSRKPAASVPAVAESESLVPEKWEEVVAEINMTKKQKRVISRELKFGSKVERRRMQSGTPDLQEYLTYRQMKLSQLNPVVLDDPVELPPLPSQVSADDESGFGKRVSERAAPRNPRAEVAAEGLDSINEFFNSGDYVPGEIYDEKKPKGSRKFFTKEEKILLNKRIPSLAEATSRKWFPLHALAASGEFYLLDALLKHNVDINAVDMGGLSAIHKAILGKKQAILNYLLRESANPFLRDSVQMYQYHVKFGNLKFKTPQEWPHIELEESEKTLTRGKKNG